ncbi:MAG: ArsR family transcriptional regulator [Opitutales bacterium]|nr:ArsR family transcriptional regulator [Opitutales bacterium]
MSQRRNAKELPSEAEATALAINEFFEQLRSIRNEKALRILLTLDNLGEANVSKIVRHTRLSQPEVSMALAKLKVSGAVEFQRDGRLINYWIGSQFVKEAVLSLRHRIDVLLERDENPLRKNT